MRISFLRFFFLNICCLLLGLASCSKDDLEGGEGSSFASGPIELPVLRNSENDIFLSPTTYIDAEEAVTFSLEYDTSKKHARWVAFKYYNATGQVNWNRDDWDETEWGGDPFQPDPQVPQAYQRVRSDFGAKGFDRGHICASADRLYSKESNEQTFYYTNMSPQKNYFNVGVWGSLEDRVRTWGRSSSFRDTLYVVKGGTIDNEGQIWSYIGGDRTKPVPKYYYMALLCQKGGTFKTIGFWMDQSTTSRPPLSTCAKSIDELEQLTGLDFFHHLTDKLEQVVEGTYTLSAWPGIK